MVYNEHLEEAFLKELGSVRWLEVKSNAELVVALKRAFVSGSLI